MRHLLLLCSVVFGLLSVSAQEQIETESIASDDVVDVNKPLKVVREINGGTVFKISYGDGFNIQMKGAFEHACKILEEYLPPCLPITVRVEWGSIGSSTSGQVLSKVSTNAKDNFGTYGELSNVMPKIKAVTLGEYVINSNVTFFNSIPNVSFFDNPDKPDIRIVYNESLQREFSYSLEADYEPYDTYDFVSVVIRDLLKGLGFFNRLRKDPLQNKIINPVWRPNDFEFGFVGSMPQCSSDDFFSDVTSGSVELYVGSSLPGIKLYAPETWADGMSLNYFIPDDTYALSNSLSYQFGRGSIVRDINDKYANDIFRRLLGWKNDLAVGSVGGASSSGGSTQNFIPFNGEFKIKKHDADDVNNVVNFATRSDFSSDKLPLVEYLDQFHPGQGMAGEEACSNSLTMAILKKDGTWDIVYRVFSPQYLLEDAKINMGDFEFHYDQS